MKRLWIAFAILAAVFMATLWNAHYLYGITSDLTVLLTQAETMAEDGKWDEAKAFTQKAYEEWQSNDGYLHVTLRHSDTDQVYTGFREVREFITCQEGGEYSAANARLIAQIELICGAEQLNLKNLL